MVDVNCPNSSKANINWSFPDVPSRTAIGNRYEIEPISGQCPDTAYKLTLRVGMAGTRFYAPPYNIYPSFAWYGTFEEIVEEKRYPYDIQPSLMVYYKDINGVSKRWGMRGGQDGRGQTLFGVNERSADIVGSDFYLIGDWEIISIEDYFTGEPDDCGGYRITIYDGDELVTQSEGANRPEVTYSCIPSESYCPEGTCEVICGDTICCYNSQGISVQSFPRT